MGRSCFLTVLLISALLALSFSHGFGRNLMTTEEEDSAVLLLEEKFGEARNMVEVMDYKDPGANTNPRSGLPSPPNP